MCGITGYCGKVKPEFSKIKLASMFITDRGKHSVGLLLNGFVQKGIYKTYNDDDSDPIKFFTKWYWSDWKKGKDNTVLVHNRSATRGAHTVDNAHPFVFEKDGVTYHFMKNGTLTNEIDLCREYDISINKFAVDSQLLGHIIVNHGWEVVTKYKGACVCVLTRTDEPNTVYIFKGESLTGDLLEEERPLFFYKTKNGMYFSSTKASLQCAHDIHEDEVVSFSANYLYKIVNGEVESKIYYDRTNVQNKSAVVISTNASRQTTHYPDYSNGYNGYYKNKSKKEKKEEVRFTFSQYEKQPSNFDGKTIYYYRGLYYRNGHPISGAYAVNDAGQIDNDSENIPIYHFHLGILCKNKEAADALSDCIKSVKDIRDKWHLVNAHAHPEHIIFSFRYSEKRAKYKLYVYKDGNEIESSTYTVTPKFSSRRYCFQIVEGYYTIEQLENKSFLPETWEDVSSSSLFPIENENFNDSIIKRDRITILRFNHLKKSIEAFLSYLSKGDDSSVIEENVFKKVCILYYFLENSMYAETIYEELYEEILETVTKNIVKIQHEQV